MVAELQRCATASIEPQLQICAFDPGVCTALDWSVRPSNHVSGGCDHNNEKWERGSSLSLNQTHGRMGEARVYCSLSLSTSIRVLQLSIRINQSDQLNLVPVLRNMRLLCVFKSFQKALMAGSIVIPI